MRIFDRIWGARPAPDTELDPPSRPPLSDLQMVPLADHRRIVESALLARDKAWLKKLRAVEAMVMWPWHGPVTTLILSTEREIDDKMRKLQGDSD